MLPKLKQTYTGLQDVHSKFGLVSNKQYFLVQVLQQQFDSPCYLYTVNP
jgi:hypothetical protein